MGGHAVDENAVAGAKSDSGDNCKRKKTEQQAAGKLFPLAVRRDQAGFAPGSGADRAHQRPKTGQREQQQRAVHETVKRRAGDLGKRMRDGLREPVKPRREQGAADEHQDQINDQRPKRPHDATIRFRAVQAKREFRQCPDLNLVGAPLPSPN